MRFRNVKLKPLRHTPPFRKVAVGTWSYPLDPQIYGTIELDLTKAYAWRSRLPSSAPKVTVTHMLARAVARAMAKYPDLNGLIRFRKIYLRQSVDIAFLVAVAHESGKEDLSAMRLEGLDQKGVVQIAAEMAARLERVRKKKDTPLQKSTGMLKLFPGFMVRFLLWLMAFISYTLNIRFPGVPPDQFAGCIITNVGPFGLDIAYAPLVPYSRAPVLLLLGESKKRPVVIDDRIEIREIVTVNATVDHRFCDGSLLAKMVKVVRETFDDPETHFGGLELAVDPS